MLFLKGPLAFGEPPSALAPSANISSLPKSIQAEKNKLSVIFLEVEAVSCILG